MAPQGFGGAHSSRMEARGHSMARRTPAFLTRILGWILSLTTSWAVGLVLISSWFGLSWWNVLILLVLILSVILSIRWAVRFSLTQRITLSVLTFAALVFLFPKPLLHHPLLVQPKTLSWDAYIPDVADSIQWSLRPYFYLLGAWPVSPGDRFQLPYEKRPPERFVARIVHYWDYPSLLLSVDGPATYPAALPFRECMAKHRLVFVPLGPCNKAMQSVLEAEWAMLRSLGLPFPQVTHFKTPLIEGLLLESESPHTRLLSAVFVSPTGTTQSVRLTAIGPSLLPDKWNIAKEHFMDAIRAQQFAPDLGAGRALSATKLSELTLSKSPSWRVSGELLGMASVDPRSYEPFYHLARLNLLWAETVKSQEEKALHLALGKSALQYASDIRPDEPRNEPLQKALARLEGK